MGDKTFRGGVHPEEMKELSCEKPLIPYAPVGDLVFLTSQHIGKPAVPVVKKGDKVSSTTLIGSLDTVPSECLDPAHLHLEFLKDGKPVSASKLFK